MEFVQSSFNNSSTISSSSSSKKQRHEIFISFRGETRNSFVSHLQNALENKEVMIFSDKTSLHNGQIIANELHESIKKASIALFVFSKDYASSSWCLDELVWILEHKNNGGLIVMPIFYDVDPSDVRKQKNSFAKSFEEHEAGRFKDLPETILNWKNALKEITSLVGEDIRGQDEASCVKKIVNDVISRLPSRTHYTADQSRITNLKIEINSRNNNELVSSIGIYGEARIGKTTTATTLAEELEQDIAEELEQDIAEELEDIAEELEDIAEELEHDIDEECDKIKEEMISATTALSTFAEDIAEECDNIFWWFKDSSS